MRLGDLDKLKKEVENLVVGGEEGLKDYYENGSKSDENSWISGVYDAWELICNAQTVERPQGDLISRSEVEKLGATCLAKRNENGQLEAIISLDNAPTVDLWQLRQEATENALKKAEVLYGRPQGEYETACNVLLSLEQIVRRSDGWEDSAVEAVHNAIQTAIKCMHERPHIIDNCDMNVFEPEKYTKGGAE